MNQLRSLLLAHLALVFGVWATINSGAYVMQANSFSSDKAVEYKLSAPQDNFVPLMAEFKPVEKKVFGVKTLETESVYARVPLRVVKNFEVPIELVTKLLNSEELKTRGTLTSASLKGLKHQVEGLRLKDQGINELIGVGYSNFTGSDSARRYNILRAAEQFDGQVIKQGDTFSFNNILQDATSRNGYRMAKVIINGGTKYGWGGGICQVSTTIFRSAFNTGLPVPERRNHSYPVSYYTPQGFDATIYLGQQDLKFTNNTPGDVMLQFVVKEDDLLVLMYGTKDRETVVSGPYRNGMAYRWFRTVYQDSEKHEEILFSRYKSEVKPVVARQADKSVELVASSVTERKVGDRVIRRSFNRSRSATTLLR